MSSIRSILPLAALLAMAALPLRSATSTEAEYVGGTAKGIPLNAIGSLSFDDSKELRFQYGKSVFRLPYTSITATDVATRGHFYHVLGHIPVPRLFTRGGPQIFSIRYKDATGNGTASFEMSSKAIPATREALAARLEPQSGALAAAPAPGNQPEAWWGDHVWKTTRNRSTWPGDKDPAATTATGTK
jgi:hypothetical protein